jgi:hypothetical protein
MRSVISELLSQCRDLKNRSWVIKCWDICDNASNRSKNKLKMISRKIKEYWVAIVQFRMTESSSNTTSSGLVENVFHLIWPLTHYPDYTLPHYWFITTASVAIWPYEKLKRPDIVSFGSVMLLLDYYCTHKIRTNTSEMIMGQVSCQCELRGVLRAKENPCFLRFTSCDCP